MPDPAQAKLQTMAELTAERNRWKETAEKAMAERDQLLLKVYDLFLSVPFEGIPVDERDGIIEDASIDNAIKSDRFALMAATRELVKGDGNV